MMLFSHWLFSLKNWRFSTISCKGFIVSLSKLSDAVKNEVVKKTLYDELVKKFNAI